MTRILVTGSRDWVDTKSVFDALERATRLAADVTIVHGDCPSGADAIADDWALINGHTPERHPADWNRYGKAAGFRRNAEMVALGADICLAFIKNESRGASHTARTAEAAGIRTIRHHISEAIPQTGAP